MKTFKLFTLLSIILLSLFVWVSCQQNEDNMPSLDIIEEEVNSFDSNIENHENPFPLQITGTEDFSNDNEGGLRLEGGCPGCSPHYETLYVHIPIRNKGDIYEINHSFPYADIQVSNFSCKLLNWDGKGHARIKFNSYGTFEVLIGAYRDLRWDVDWEDENGNTQSRPCYCLETLYRYIFEVKTPSPEF